MPVTADQLNAMARGNEMLADAMRENIEMNPAARSIQDRVVRNAMEVPSVTNEKIVCPSCLGEGCSICHTGHLVRQTITRLMLESE